MTALFSHARVRAIPSEFVAGPPSSRMLEPASRTRRSSSVISSAVRAKYARLVRALPSASVFYAMKCNSSPADAATPARASGPGSRSHRSVSWRCSAAGVAPDGRPVQQPDQAPAPSPGPTPRPAAVQLRLRGRAAQVGQARARRRRLRPAARRRQRQRLPAVAQVRLRRAGRARSDAVGSRARPQSVRHHLPRRVTVLRAGGVATGDGGDAQAHAAAAARRHRDRRCSTSAAVSRPATATAVPEIEQIGAVIESAISELLPYRPPLIAIEPGRHLVAESSVLVATVLGREVRASENWLYLDVGAYNGLMETQQTVGGSGSTRCGRSLADHATAPRTQFTLTGPSCDSSDTMFFGVSLPDHIDVGDRVLHRGGGRVHAQLRLHVQRLPDPGGALRRRSMTVPAGPAGDRCARSSSPELLDSLGLSLGGRPSRSSPSPGTSWSPPACTTRRCSPGWSCPRR